jgi:YVTN family beta-propeller protein
MPRRLQRLDPTALAVLALAASVLAARTADAGRRRPPEPDPKGFALFASPQADPIALSNDGSRVYVANTTSGTVSVLDASTLATLAEIEVGLDPVSVAVRPGSPDPRELWVANHVSDTVSVIDTDPASPDLDYVIATVQALDADGVTGFDEPVGIAFREDGARAYVALSSTNRIAVVDAGARAVTGTLAITAQEPRALAVRNGLLYVAAFESGNQTELSSCQVATGSDQCTVGLGDILAFATSPNLPGAIKNIVIDPDVPDRDLFVFDTADDAPVDAVTGLGTLLYGLAVDSTGRAYVSGTDARNAVNGADGLVLGDLDNRMFLNRIASAACSPAGCGGPDLWDLEPANPSPATALATPYGIRVSADDHTLVATAAGSNRLFTVDAATGAVRGAVAVGANPRGIALLSDPESGAPRTAYVLNTLDDSVSRVDVSDPDAPVLLQTAPVGSDPTPLAVRRGRIAFNDASASTTGTFSCASCHPDGHTDQLLWRIGGACRSADPTATTTASSTSSTRAWPA